MGEDGVCMTISNERKLENENSSPIEPKRDHDSLGDDVEEGPCTKKQAKEALDVTELDPCGAEKKVKDASHDEICSEVSNPVLSPQDNASSVHTISSQLPEVLNNNKQVVACDILSTCSGNSSTEESLSVEERSNTDLPGEGLTSKVVLEIPENVSTTGIRKITFKFSKRKEDYIDQIAPQSISNVIDRNYTSMDDPYADGKGFHSDSKKVVPDGYPTSVKKLLSSGVLEGACVKYVSPSEKKELPGIIRGNGYLCSCSLCNYSKTLTAYEFELHAGGKTRHPNNHIHFENGNPIYGIIQELKTAPLSTLDEVIKNVAGSCVNEEHLQAWKASLQHNNYMSEMGKKHVKVPVKHPSTRPNIPLSSSVVKQKKTADGCTRKRDNDLHKLLFMPNGLPDGTDLAYYSKGQRILSGYKQGSGIVCSHCSTEISPSQFEAHAGWSARRQPYRNIYTSSGLSLHDIALSLASGQRIATGKSDDMCTVCGDAGDLILCGGCPRSFHAACLDLQSVPESNWHCAHCKDKSSPGKKAIGGSSNIGGPIIIRLNRVVKAPESDIGGCVFCRAHDFSVANFDDRTVMLCDQCEREYHVGCLRNNGFCDLKELPKDKWFCCDYCSQIHSTLQNLVGTGAQLIPTTAANIINKKHQDNGLPGVMENDIRWQILSGKSRCREHLPLLSRAAAIFRECFDPIVARSGRDLIPVMVYGRNISGQEFGGIYCVVLIVNSTVVSAGLLRVFGREVAELPIVATSQEFQGKGYFQALFSCIETLLHSMEVETLVLPAAEDAEPIWTKKLGFLKRTDEQLWKYTRQFQITVFKGTSMLEKAVQPVQD
ncbi:uncharacterized protein LOC124920110 [Impatiens glandulifera]|uniref:uncharacterized protein LOC124920110 n=1 Tax=Impatiens glandulifera TaxID=253017 RepID=UPI001FB182AF|nr:uncharacterized protein LOC124920110 [Impatiens glandulifera]XP_047316477.1 uncharacterized protein LOC124920110 [Impatiens glandulifera]